MKKLKLNFLNAQGKKHRWTLKAADQAVTERGNGESCGENGSKHHQ